MSPTPLRAAWIVGAALACAGPAVEDKSVDTDDTDLRETDAPDTDMPDTDVLDTDPQDTDVPDLQVASVITVSATAGGDFSCVGAPGEWRTPTVDRTCVVDAPIEADLRLFPTDVPGVGLNVDFWFSGRFIGAPNASLISGEGGLVSGASGPTCTTWTVRITDAATETTYVQHMGGSTGPTLYTDLVHVAAAPLAELLDAFGVTLDPTKGVLTGAAYACTGAAIEDVATGVQVIARTPDGRYPGTQSIHYFVGSRPSPSSTSTSADGIWLIANVPTGDLVVETYAVLGEGQAPRKIAETIAQAFAGSATIVDTYASLADGRHVDEACESPCESP